MGEPSGNIKRREVKGGEGPGKANRKGLGEITTGKRGRKGRVFGGFINGVILANTRQENKLRGKLAGFTVWKKGRQNSQWGTNSTTTEKKLGKKRKVNVVRVGLCPHGEVKKKKTL